MEDQVVVEDPPPKDLSELGAEVTWSAVNTFSTQVNATAAGIHIFYRRATSGATKVSTISVEVPVTRFKFNNWFGCSRVISEATVSFDDTFEAVSDPPINALENQTAAAFPRQEAQVVGKPHCGGGQKHFSL